MEIIYFSILFVIWFGFWFIYNFVLLKKGISTEKTPAIMAKVYFLSSTISLITASLFSYGKNTIPMFILISLVLGITLYSKNIYTSRISNSTFQMVWLFVFVEAMKYNSVGITLAFWLGHFPVLFIKHLNLSGKLVVYLFSLFGGIVFTLFFIGFQFPINILCAIALHFIFYMILRPFDKKFKWGIVN